MAAAPQGRPVRMDPAALPAAGVRATRDSGHEDYRWTLTQSGELGGTARRLQKSDTLRGESVVFPTERPTPSVPRLGPRNKPDYHYVDDIAYAAPSARPGLTFIQPPEFRNPPTATSPAASSSPAAPATTRTTAPFPPAPAPRETNPLSPTYRWNLHPSAVSVYPLGPSAPTPPLGCGSPPSPASPLSRSQQQAPGVAAGGTAGGGGGGGGAGGSGGVVPRGGAGGPRDRVSCSLPDLRSGLRSEKYVDRCLEIGDIQGARAPSRTRHRKDHYSAFDYSDVPGTSSKPSSPVRQRMLQAGRDAPPPIDTSPLGLWAGATGRVPQSMRHSHRPACNPNQPEYLIYGHKVADEGDVGRSRAKVLAASAQVLVVSGPGAEGSGRLPGTAGSMGPSATRRSWNDPGESGLVGQMETLRDLQPRTWPRAAAPLGGPAARQGGVAVAVAGGAAAAVVAATPAAAVRVQREVAAAVAEVAALI